MLGFAPIGGLPLGDAGTNGAPAPASTVTMVSVTPGTATGSQQFTATVVGMNSPSQVVTWTASAGSIDASGLFTAPAQTSLVQTITITATSTQDLTKSGTATVTIAAATVISTVTGVSLNPTSASGSQQFVATVVGTNSQSQAVTWSTTAGSISSTGYLTISQSSVIQTVTVTATSTQDGTKSGTAIVTVAVFIPGRVAPLTPQVLNQPYNNSLFLDGKLSDRPSTTSLLESTLPDATVVNTMIVDKPISLANQALIIIIPQV